MAVWSTTRLSVSEVNTLVSVVSTIVSYCMGLMLASVSLGVRRLMIVRGERNAIIQDSGYGSIWSALKKSNARRLTALAVLPMLLHSTASTIIGFATSGVSASIVYARGTEVAVLGLAGEGVSAYEQNFYSISDLALDAQSRGFNKTAYLTLLSPEIVSMGFRSRFSDMEVGYAFRNNSGEEGVYLFGRAYQPPLTVDTSFCVEIDFIQNDDAFAVAACRENLVVETIEKAFNVVSLTTEVVLDHDCSELYTYIALGNQGVGVVTRNITFRSGKQAAATCSSIFESAIESFVWQDLGVLYFGDWNVRFAGTCDENTFFPNIAAVGIQYEPEVAQGSDTASLLAAMTAEIFGGTGLLSSRQQLVDILGVVIRLECMKWNLHVAFDPVDAVQVSTALWVPSVLLLALILPLITLVLMKYCGRGGSFFLPVDPAGWSACAAREVEEGTTTVCTVPPREEHYDKVYAFGSRVAGGTDAAQHLGWVSRQEVTPANKTTLMECRLTKAATRVVDSRV